MTLLTDKEIIEAINNGRKANKHDGRDGILVNVPPEYLRDKRYCLKAQLKKTLISVGKESKRMDGTIYLVPDYVEYRKALKEVGLE